MKTLREEQKLSILKSVKPSALDKLKFEDLVLYFTCAIGVSSRECQWEGLQALNRRLNRPTLLEAMTGSIQRRVLLGLYSEDQKSLPTCRYSLATLNQFLNSFYPDLSQALVKPPPERSSRADDLKIFEHGKRYIPKSTYVFVRKHWWPGNENTRHHEFWYLIPQFFRELGFDPICVDANDFEATLDVISGAKENDLVFLDLQVPTWPHDIHQKITSVLSASKPKVIGLVGDYWRIKNSDFYDQYAEVLSCILSGGASDGESEAGSGCPRANFPQPMTGEILTRTSFNRAQNSLPMFAGSIEENNFPRLLWYSLLGGRDDFAFNISSIRNDNLSARDSYLNYIEYNAAHKILCNFGARSNGEVIVTGRFYESIAIGATLLQEWSPPLSRFFVEGEHFLSFSTYSELETILERLRSSRDPMEIGRKGREYALRNYSVDKWYSYLCTFF